MWVYLKIEPDGPGTVGLVKGEGNVFCPILYDATCRAVAAAFPDVIALDGLVIPESLGRGYRYYVDSLILQLRLETESGLQRLPILVQIDDQDRYMSPEFCSRLDLTEEGIVGIGVDQIAPGETPSIARAPQPNLPKVHQFVERRASRFLKEGRHSQANRWGPYILFRVLECLDSSFAKKRESIETKMFEEPYLKRLAGAMGEECIPDQLLVKLRSERDRFRNRLLGENRDRKILVVEDQLAEGWREVYEVIFDAADPHISVDWATTVPEAHDKFEKDMDLVILDVRLDPRDEATSSGDDQVPTGVTLAKWLRKQSSPIPILAATASNKTWTLEPLLKEGIQGYWVKESPEQTGKLVHAARNVIDFYRKAGEILEWSDCTRPWIERLYEIADQVSASDVPLGEVLRKKAQSLHALLDRAFSPFSKQLDEGLQFNVAFLILFSCMNDLRVWCCRMDEKADGTREWKMVEELGKLVEPGDELLVRYDPHDTKHDKKYVMEVDGKECRDRKFHDTNVFRELLMRLGCTAEALLFGKLRDKRNDSPLTHGGVEKEPGRGRADLDATRDDLNRMLAVLWALVDKRRSARGDAT